MEVRFIDGPMKGQVLPVLNKTVKFVLHQPMPKGHDIEEILCDVPIKDIVYTIRQENGEWIGEMDE